MPRLAKNNAEITRKEKIMDEHQSILIYQSDDGSVKLDVRLKDESVWVTRQQMAVLFDRDVKTIGKHINNIFAEGELEKIQLSQNL